MAEEAAGKADLVLIAAPEVLGDTYEDVILNMSVISQHGLMIAIAPPDPATGPKLLKVEVDV